jgi:hypothetical protein
MIVALDGDAMLRYGMDYVFSPELDIRISHGSTRKGHGKRQLGDLFRVVSVMIRG